MFSSVQVVDEHTTLTKPEPKNNHTHILKSDWFWYTIQNGYANEMDYLFGDVSRSLLNCLPAETNIEIFLILL